MDIGNTNIEIGVLSDKVDDLNVIASVRYYTRLDETSDQIGLFIYNFLNKNNINSSDIRRVVFSSVVPPLNNIMKQMFLDYFSKNILEVNEKTKLNIVNYYKNPKQVGSDRLVNAVAVFHLFKKDCIIVDLGTATTLCVVTKEGKYLGGSIFPGIVTSTQALTQKAASLPPVRIQKKEKLLCEDTASAIESGVYHSYYYALRGMMDKLSKEVGYDDYITIGTGGFISIFKESNLFSEIDPLLTLKGLKIIVDLN